MEVYPHCGGSLRMTVKGLYTLRRRKGLWQVVFDGQAGQFKHEKGAEYVARLLVERGPMHALELTTKAADTRGVSFYGFPSPPSSHFDGRTSDAARSAVALAKPVTAW